MFGATAAGALLIGGSFFVHDHYDAVNPNVSGPVPHSHDREYVFGLGLATYFLGAPILHVLHHRNGTALESLALRVGLPLGAMLVGGAVASGSNADDFGGIAVGLIAGVVAAGAIDIGYLSVAERPATFSPSVIVSHGAMTLGVARAF